MTSTTSMTYEVIAIGASWGGLQAVGTVLDGIAVELDQPIVIAQHRSAESNRGALASLLQSHIARPVSEPVDKETVEPRHVYVAPADYHLLVDGARFALLLVLKSVANSKSKCCSEGDATFATTFFLFKLMRRTFILLEGYNLKK